MARDLPRTASDDRAAALLALDALEREVPNLRAWLAHPIPEPGALRQATQIACDVLELARTIRDSAAAGARRAADETTARAS